MMARSFPDKERCECEKRQDWKELHEGIRKPISIGGKTNVETQWTRDFFIPCIAQNPRSFRKKNLNREAV